MGWWDRWRGFLLGRPLKEESSDDQNVPMIEVSALPSASEGVSYRYHDGEHFFGGFGDTQILTIDYWTLRARSSQLFRTNLYARGLIRRLVTNEINTGLHLEAVPEEAILGLEEDDLSDWSEMVENRWALWERNPTLCDYRERRTFGALQAAARVEALVAGDVLAVLRQDQRTGLPRVQLVSGAAIRTPMGARPRRGHRIVHGVELDAQGRHAAYWITREDGSPKRLPAWGERSGRRIAWLIYGTDVRLDDVRGEPILSLMLQALREVDRYRHATLRKAVITSMLALFIKKGEDRPGTTPITGGAVRRETVTTTDGDGTKRSFNTAKMIPGLVIDELQHGEEPKAFPSQGTDEKFGDFEEAVVQAIAWANEIPPEILRLSFSNNYSASQAAINEFKMYLNKVRTTWGETFCQPIYIEWLISQALSGKISAPGFLDAWRDPSDYDLFSAWISADWAGHIKPAVDVSKLVKGYREMVEEGFITRDRASRELTGTKYSKNVQKLLRENEQLAAARGAIEPNEPEPRTEPVAPADDADEEGDEEGDEELREAG